MTYTPYDENAITKQFHVARFHLNKIFIGDSTGCVLSGPEESAKAGSSSRSRANITNPSSNPDPVRLALWSRVSAMRATVSC